ncbi:MAG: protein translocase subunit SecD [Candidatus Solibacter usitatus]|nr:protein translocase subunit SecD [Candidatus Solibacter usitatus]
MEKQLRIKGLIILGIILASIYGIVGLPKSKDEVIANWKKNIRLGLDLRGGSHLVLEVQVQDAFKAEADADTERLKEDLNKANVTFLSIDRNEPSTIADADKIEIQIKGVPIDKAAGLRTVVSEKHDAWVLGTINSTDYRLTMKPTKALDIRHDTLKNSMATIESRINGLGLAESTVQQRGQDSESKLLVQLPGVDDPARIKQILGTAALLELYDVREGPYGTRDQARQSMPSGVLPIGTKMIKSPARASESEQWYIVARTPVITGRDLRNARPQQGEMGKWETAFTLNQDAAKRFGRYTESHIGKRLAIVLDGNVRGTPPVIQNRIEDSGRIMGARDEHDAADLALVLRSGSLPASVVYLEERTVGPSLGADSIRQGITSGIAGVIAVVMVMLVYYRRAGVNATLALILNAIILIAALAYFEAVLTLPGIAGVILTIGMAVDSNVLIFERIREELRSGKSVAAAIDTGFSKAFLTIIDTHVTTVVSCAFLFMFGSGPVKGFAVSLVIGLIANVFTSVFISRFIFDWETSGKRQLTTLSI